MKHFTLKKHLAALLLLLCGTVAMAHNFEVDGIYYNITDADACTVEVTYEGDNYGYNAEYVGSVTIPESVVYGGVTYSVTTIGEYAFYDCNVLTSITIPNSVTTIGGWAFDQCYGLTSITIPYSVTTIEYYAFEQCSKLTSIVVESGNTNYDSREGCNAIIETATNTLITGCRNTVIPGSVTTIGYRAFNGCDDLTSITIPNSVTTIENYAFQGCSGLTSITIPNSVTTIGYGAFQECI